MTVKNRDLEVERLRSTWKITEAGLRGDIEERDRQIQVLDLRVQDYQRLLGDLDLRNGRVKVLEDQLVGGSVVDTAMRLHISELERAVEANGLVMSGRIEIQNREVAKLESEVAVLGQSQLDLRETIAARDCEVAKLQSEVAMPGQSQFDMRETIESRDRQVANLESEVALHVQSQLGMDESMQSRVSHIARLEDELQQCQGAAVGMRETIKARDLQVIVDLEDQAQRATQDMIDSVEARAKLQGQVCQVTVEMRDTVEARDRRIANLEGQVEQVTVEMREGLSSRDDRIHDLEGQVDRVTLEMLDAGFLS